MLVDDYYERRNGISAAALGDKCYKAPQYSSEFFKEPGIVIGSTNSKVNRNFARKKEVDFTIDPNAKYPFYPTVLWADRVKKDQRDDELNAVGELENWEATILKEHLGPTEEELEEQEKNKDKKKKAAVPKKGVKK